MPRKIKKYYVCILISIVFTTAAFSEESTGWKIAGPFSSSVSESVLNELDFDYLTLFKMSASGEAEARATTVSSVGEMAWKDAKAAATNNGVDFIAAFGAVENSVAYAYRSFHSSAAVQTVMQIGSDDGVKIWLNGELVFGNHVNRSLVDGQDAVLVKLREGENRLLVKVAQGWGDWGFSLTFSDPEVERRRARTVKPVSLRICLDNNTTPPGGSLTGTIVSEPAALIDGYVLVHLIDGSGAVLGSARCTVSERFSIPVPEKVPELCYVRAEGKGEASGLRSVDCPIGIGDAAYLFHSALATARTVSSVLRPGAEGNLSTCPDPKATLKFLVSAIRGEIPSGLKTRDSTLLALKDIKAIAYNGAPLGGLHRYAYHSSFDGSVQPYTLYVPGGYDSRQRYGLVLALHGAQGNDWDMAAAIAAAEPKDMLVLAPYGRGDMGWSTSGERDAIDVLDLVTKYYSIDPDRIYLTGRSMGGFGTWRLGSLYASRFAAIAAFAGWTGDDSLENLINIPVLVVHGEDDETVPIDSDRRAVQILQKLGARVRFDSLPGVGHDAMGAWMQIEGPERLLKWFRQWKRSAWPSEVRARTSQARYGRQYWIGVEELIKPLTQAAIDSKILDGRHISIDTENVALFSIDLGHPKLAESGRLLLLVDGINLTVDAGSRRAFFALGSDGRFRVMRDNPVLLPNGGGGLAGIFDDSVCIVYGSARPGRTAINREAARVLASFAGATTVSIGAVSGLIPVVSDMEVDDDIIKNKSLILVGCGDENRVLARIAQHLALPLSAAGGFSAGGREYKGTGMIQICPNPEAPNRLVCVFSFPFEKTKVVSYAAGLLASVRSFGDGQSGICGFGTPDLMVVDRSKGLLWSGSFDRGWKRLIELSSQ